MELKHRIRALWCNSNAAERKLWQALQNPQSFNPNNNPNQCDLSEQPDQLQNPHFVRHVVLGDFFVDFLCEDLKLVIELDGGLSEAAKKQASLRTTALQYKGFLVVSLFQQEVLDNLQGVLDGLNLILNQRKHCLVKHKELWTWR